MPSPESIVIRKAVDGFFAAILPNLLGGMATAINQELQQFDQDNWIELMAFFTGEPTVQNTRRKLWQLVGSGQLSAETVQTIDKLLAQQPENRTITLEDFQRSTQAPDLTVDDLLAWLDQQPPNQHRQQCKQFLLAQPRSARVEPNLVREITRPMLRSANP